MKYALNYTVSRVDSDADEVAEEASLDFSPATADGPFLDEYSYQVSHEITAKDDQDAIAQAKEIIDASALGIDIFSVTRDGESIFTEEDNEE